MDSMFENARDVMVSVNPRAGARSGEAVVEELVAKLERRGFHVEITSNIQHLGDQTAEKLAAGTLRAVVAAGGDGTAALIVNHTPPGTPIAVLPLGTENLLAKYLGIKSDATVVADVIEHGQRTVLDAGMADDRIFLLMAGCGFDADVVRRLHGERKGHIHHLSYVKPIFESIRKYQYPELRIFADELAGDQPLIAKWVFVVNLPRYAGGLSFVPAADGADGLLDVCTFKEGSLWAGLMYLSGVVMGQHQNWSDCVTFQTRRLRIECDAAAPFQTDGDPGGFLPVEIQALPNRLTVLTPASPTR